MKRKHKSYSRPKRPFDKVRLDEESKIKKDFGLKNKKEIWKADAKIKAMREKAKKLIKATPEEQKALFEQLQKMGLKVNSIAEILALGKNDYLERRLQTVVSRKGLANSVNGARQMITHKKVLVNGRVINIPSYIVKVEEEDKITIKEMKKPKAKEKVSGEDVAETESSEEEAGEVPEQEKAEVVEDEKKTQEEVKETTAEAEGK